jgi:hypothetical protein
LRVAGSQAAGGNWQGAVMLPAFLFLLAGKGRARHNFPVYGAENKKLADTFLFFKL